ncbi:MAG: hypothetical protein IPG60_00280 [Bacteroidetes bacterium]|nr:hypothetical protein [Bacteroidota bacterium]MBP7398908.1 hypothetical protein [Chitinophagales bacterium]MBK7107936.1 hypothetical protein [Bacteroidota bacterium]MBK8486631.1 hypothetical protein [Bacteroidota bacterium]MBK8683412.1 hypothetical protein [Bacteroidota bacterium]
MKKQTSKSTKPKSSQENYEEVTESVKKKKIEEAKNKGKKEDDSINKIKEDKTMDNGKDNIPEKRDPQIKKDRVLKDKKYKDISDSNSK